MTDTRAVIYVRASQDREGKETSVTDQERACRALADRRGLTVTAVYRDNDRGASTLSRKARPEYAQMLADARAGKFGTVLAYSSSRLTRRPQEFETLIELAEKHGVKIMTDRSGDQDFTTAQGRGVARTIAAWDAVQAEQTGENIRSSIAGRLAAGKDLGGSRPFGFEASRTEIRESEARWVREAHRRILDEGAAVYAVAKWLSESGVATTGAASQWTARATRAMLLRPRNAGILVHKGVEVPGSTLPAIVSREDHEAIKALLNDPARAPKRGPRAVHLLSGIAKCGVCGYTLAHTTSSKGGGRSYPIYRCTNNAPIGRGTHPTMRDATLEGEVEGLFLDRIAESEDNPAGPDVGRIRDISTRLAEIASERTQATQLGLLPGADMKAVAGKLTALTDEEKNLTAEKDALVSANVSGAAFDAFREYVKKNAGSKTWGYLVARDSAYEVWEKYDLDRKRDILRGFDIKLWPKSAEARITVEKR